MVVCLVWVTALISRITLQTALGEGFAPAGAIDLRSALPLLGQMLALAALQYVALQALQTVTSVIGYLVIFASLLGGPRMTLVSYPLGALFGFAVFALGYGYLSLTVPALANEARSAPDWIGKPVRPTNPLTAFERSFRLVGLRGAGRALGVFLGALLAVVVVDLLLSVALTVVIGLFGQALGARTEAMLSNPWLIGGALVLSSLLALAVVTAFLAAVQTLFYLDLRIRREGLDLALRFDCVPVPQPSAAPRLPPPPLPPAPPAPAPLPPSRPSGPVA